MGELTLILGGARSGKTALAERVTEAAGPARTYLATAEAHDAEMAERIARHRAQRGAGWSTLEAPLEAAGALAGADGAVLVDCLTIWLSNLMHADRDWEAATAGLLTAARGREGPVVMVSNEVGLGIVPDNRLARAFRDAQGRVNQIVAAEADGVAFVAAGLPLWLKGQSAGG